MNCIIIGDIILDHNIYTTVQTPKRIDYNTEHNIDYEEYKLGGCGNVATNLHSLGANHVYLFSAIGSDENGRRLNELIDGLKIHNRLLTVPDYNTTVKHRYYHNKVPIFQSANKINKELLMFISFCEEIELLLKSVKIDCIILCESEMSSLGILSIYHCRQIIELANKYAVPTIVDPKENIDKYRGCTLIKPNRDEAYHLTSMARNDLIIDVHGALRQRIKCKYSLITLGADGASLYDGIGETCSVYDGTLTMADAIGAGDIITSIIGVLFNKVNLKDAVRIAVRAASKSVELPGVVTVSRQGVLGKYLEFADLCVLRTLFHNKSIGVTTGCFDLLHSGHLVSLSWCKKNCDILVVCLNSDESIRLLKGADRPIQPLDVRLAALTTLSVVDYIIVFSSTTAVDIVRALKPDVFMKGGDYLDKSLVESSFARKTLIGPFLSGVSTTEIVRNSNLHS